MYALAVGTLAISAAEPAHAADRSKVSSTQCETFWLYKHTSVLNYDIVEERTADDNVTPDAEYFRLAAHRTAKYCDRTSNELRQPLGPSRRIRGVWFQSNDGSFETLFDVDTDAIDFSAGVTNQNADRFAAEQRMATQKAAAERQPEAQLEQIRMREARACEVKDAEEKVKRDKAAAELARQKVFFDDKVLQVERLGTPVQAAKFTFVNDVRTDPFHSSKLGAAVLGTRSDRMTTEKIAMFGSELAPVFVHLEDVDSFTLFGEYIGANACAGDDYQHVSGAPPRG